MRVLQLKYTFPNSPMIVLAFYNLPWNQREEKYGITLCSSLGKMHVFMSPLPKYIRKPQMLQYFFPVYRGYDPLVFIDEPFDFNFF